MVIINNSRNNKMLKSILKRFLKGFIGGGVASMLLVLKAGILVQSLADLKTLGFTLGVAFVTGGLLAIEKWASWTEFPPQPSN